MTQDLLITNAQIVTPDEVIFGTVEVRSGHITAVDRGLTGLATAIDFDGDYLIPGLIELHTDNLERHFTPRPGVHWPAVPAVMAHDAEIAAAGITTVFNAIAIGDIINGSTRLNYLEEMARGVHEARERKVTRADHRLHLRCEISFAGVLDLFEPFSQDPLVRLVSLMDHSPGQRQFANVDKYREYYQGKYRMTDDEIESLICRQQEASATYGTINRRKIVDFCHDRKLALASHDDATADHVAEAARQGMTIAEFPTTLEAADLSRQHGMKTLMGAPNVVRGHSHSGNVSARYLAKEGLVDILSSDYFPSSLLQGAFTLAKEIDGIDLPDAIATVTAHPAAAVGLRDRGRILPGKKADLVRVALSDDVPVVRHVWRDGGRVV
ncbi:MAG: alpha-D-ribose 1-methylphosphonate 5-triphosphate diphosphatase [Magnetospiraceae bacterium]